MHLHLFFNQLWTWLWDIFPTWFFSWRASLGTPFSQWIPIFSRENELIFLGKMEIPCENGIPKLTRRFFFPVLCTLSKSGSLPSARRFAECFLSGTRQSPTLGNDHVSAQGDSQQRPFCRVPNIWRITTLGKGPSAAVYSWRLLSLPSARCWHSTKKVLCQVSSD